MRRTTLRAFASAAVGLVVLLALEWPVLAYPSAPVVSQQITPTGIKHRLPASLFEDSTPRLSPLGVRRAAATSAAAGEADENEWVPTEAEGAVFTVLGTSMVCGGTVAFTIGMAKLMPVVAEFGGLVTAAVGPLILAGVGLTLLFVGIPFLIHGLKALKVVRAAETTAVSSSQSDLGEVRRVILLRF